MIGINCSIVALVIFFNDMEKLSGQIKDELVISVVLWVWVLRV